jgi:hypothetical protein
MTESIAVRALPARWKLPFTSRVQHVLAGALAGLVMGVFLCLSLPVPCPTPRTLSDAKTSSRPRDRAALSADRSRADERAGTGILGHDAQTLGMHLEPAAKDAATRAPMACVSKRPCIQPIARPPAGWPVPERYPPAVISMPASCAPADRLPHGQPSSSTNASSLCGRRALGVSHSRRAHPRRARRTRRLAIPYMTLPLTPPRVFCNHPSPHPTEAKPTPRRPLSTCPPSGPTHLSLPPPPPSAVAPWRHAPHRAGDRDPHFGPFHGDQVARAASHLANPGGSLDSAPPYCAAHDSRNLLNLGRFNLEHSILERSIMNARTLHARGCTVPFFANFTFGLFRARWLVCTSCT